MPDRRMQKESMMMEENNRKDAQEDPTPLTDEEFARFQKKQKRESRVFADIIDFSLGFLR